MGENQTNEALKVDEKLREFSVGDLADYPAHGVGRIEAIESRVINGEKQNFYIIKVIENGMTIMIPTTNVNQVGLRNVIGAEEIPDVYKVMKDRVDVNAETQTWNRRYREYMDKIKTGSLFDVAEVYRDLSLLRFTKDLSFGERKLFDTAQALLVKELSIAKDVTEEAILLEIEAFLTPSEESQPES